MKREIHDGCEVFFAGNDDELSRAISGLFSFHKPTLCIPASYNTVTTLTERPGQKKEALAPEQVLFSPDGTPHFEGGNLPDTTLWRWVNQKNRSKGIEFPQHGIVLLYSKKAIYTDRYNLLNDGYWDAEESYAYLVMRSCKLMPLKTSRTFGETEKKIA